MSRLSEWWRTRRWPWWPEAMKVARDLDAEARAAFSDDQAVGLGRVAPAPGDAPARPAPGPGGVVANPETGEETEGQVEAIIKAGLQRLTWPAALVEPAAGWTLRRTGDGIQLCDAYGGPWVRCGVGLEPRWVSAAVSWGQVLVLYGVRLGVRIPPNLGNRHYGPAERRAELQQARQAGIVATGFVRWLTP